MAHTKTLELKRVTTVYAKPDKNSQELGKVGGRTRVEVLETKNGRGCRYRWRKIAPQGWICAKTKRTRKAVTTVNFPRLKNGVLPLGRFGRVRKNSGVQLYSNSMAVQSDTGEAPTRSMSVLRKGVRRIDGKRYWRTSGGNLIESKFIRRYKASVYKGTAPKAGSSRLTLPVAWARPREKGASVTVYKAPSSDSEVVTNLPPKTEIRYLGQSKDGKFVRIGRNQWVLRTESRIAFSVTPPEEVESDELWIDVNLQEQVLVSYIGKSPIYATMISSGTRKHRTPPGKYRIERKVAQKTMASGERDKEQYSVGGVPWVMYVHKTFALHGTYWHDRMGAPRSHGCINLAPRDAQHIYNLVSPQVPAGWISANSSEENPGTLVHFRNDLKPKQSARIRYN
ncbi:MAG: L,D-transpeptidase [Kofleriaceae bacterium]|nr:L,D-transpeptidase [Kofleriaceae bacterium]